MSPHDAYAAAFAYPYAQSQFGVTDDAGEPALVEVLDGEGNALFAAPAIVFALRQDTPEAADDGAGGVTTRYSEDQQSVAFQKAELPADATIELDLRVRLPGQEKTRRIHRIETDTPTEVRVETVHRYQHDAPGR